MVTPVKSCFIIATCDRCSIVWYGCKFAFHYHLAFKRLWVIRSKNRSDYFIFPRSSDVGTLT